MLRSGGLRVNFLRTRRERGLLDFYFIQAMESTETKEIEIVLNGEQRFVPAGLTVATLLTHLEIDAARVAVELNRAIVRKVAWPNTPIEQLAQIEVVWFVGGGKTPA